RLAQSIQMEIRWRAAEPAPDSHSITSADIIVAGRAEDVVPVAAASKNVRGDFEREGCGELSVDAALVKLFVFVQVAASHDPDRQLPRGSVIRKKGARFKWFVARLVGHLLAAGGEEEHPDDEHKLKQFPLPPTSAAVTRPQLHLLLSGSTPTKTS